MSPEPNHDTNSGSPAMQEMIDARIAANGRMVLPGSVRIALGVTGDRRRPSCAHH
jgi:hypothetical protein